jgi:hypothetical protein
MQDTLFERPGQALADVADSADKAGTVLDHSPDPDDVPDEPPVESSLSGSEDNFEPHSDDEDSSTDDEGTFRFYLFPIQD